MSQTWPTKYKDIRIAEEIIEDYANIHNTQILNIFDLVFDPINKRIEFQLSEWITHLFWQFTAMYGMEQGDFIARKIISKVIIQGETLH